MRHAIPLTLAGLLAASSASAGTFTHLYSFTGGADGAQIGPVVADTAGNLYGVAWAGGDSCTVAGTVVEGGCGTVWKFDTGNNLTVLVTFDGTHGATPQRIQIRHGVLYGATGNGGSTNHGVIFKVDTSGRNFRVLHDFSGTDGCSPSTPTFDSANNLYAKVYCAANGNGAVIKIDSRGVFQTLYTFPGSPATDQPYGIRFNAATGLLYGTTISSACQSNAAGCGKIFSLTTDGATFTTLVDFATTTAGVNPVMYTQLGDVFYGDTFAGGVNNRGALFTYNVKTGKVKTRYSLTANDGTPPFPPVFGDGFTLYGTTFYGSPNMGPAYGAGTIYSLSPSGAYQTLYSFGGSNDNVNGTYPDEIPTWVKSTSTLYGSTWFGGTPSATGASISCVRPGGFVANIYGCGTIWSYKP